MKSQVWAPTQSQWSDNILAEEAENLLGGVHNELMADVRYAFFPDPIG